MTKNRHLMLLVAAVSVTAAALFTGQARAVQGGAPDVNNTYPYVGMSVFYSHGVPLWRCSGTLVSPQVYVTAGHCTGLDPDLGVAPDSAQIWFGAGPIPRGNYPTDGSTPPCAAYVGYPCRGDVGGTPHPNPLWNGFLTTPNTHDNGYVWLDTPVAMPQYGVLPPQGYLDKLATARGKQDVNFTVVGYGVQFERPNVESAIRQRVIGVTQLQDLGSHIAGGFEVRMTDSSGGGTGGSGTCFGDSGGPMFNGGYDVGDISWGTKYCKGTSAFYRTDTADALAFLGGAHR